MTLPVLSICTSRPAEARTALRAAARCDSWNGGAGIVGGVPRLGIPDLNMADSAVGVTQGARRGRYSTPLPSTIALTAGWDTGLAHDYGALKLKLAKEFEYDRDEYTAAKAELIRAAVDRALRAGGDL